MARVFARDSGADAFKATIALSECIFALYQKQEQKNEAAALTQSIDVGGIMYPTVSSAGNGDNVALVPACADRGLALRQVQWGKVLNQPEGLKFDFGIADVSAALHTDGRIEWIGKETLATLPLDTRRGLIMDRS